jgi:hypothetical protein
MRFVSFTRAIFGMGAKVTANTTDVITVVPVGD